MKLERYQKQQGDQHAPRLPYGDNGQDIREARLRGMREGLEEGSRAGRQRALAEADAVIRQESAETEQAIARLEEETRQSLAGKQAALPAQAVEKARQLLDEQLHGDDRAFLSLFAQAATHTGSVRHAVLRVNSFGHDVASRHLEWMKRQIDGLLELELRQTPGPDGLCILETESGSVDASMETQFRKAMLLTGLADVPGGGDGHVAAGY